MRLCVNSAFSATSLAQNTNYTITVKANDNAGNTAESSTTIKTKEATISVSTAITNGAIKVGDTVSYTPPEGLSYIVGAETAGDGLGSQTFTSSNSNVKDWKAWKINSTNNTIEIISSSSTATPLKLRNGQGWNNGINIMNSICSTLYSNKSKGISARNMNETDYNNKDSKLGNTIINKRNCLLANRKINDYLGYDCYCFRCLSGGTIR